MVSDCCESDDDYFELVAVDGESGEETGRVGVDRAALAADSDVWAQLFYSERFPTPRRSLTLPGKRLDDLAELVNCVAPVCGPHKLITPMNARVLLELADEYLMGGLKERCETALAAATEGTDEAIVTAADFGLKAAQRALVRLVAKLGLTALERLEPRLPVNVVAALYKQALLDRPLTLQSVNNSVHCSHPHSFYCFSDGSFNKSCCFSCKLRNSNDRDGRLAALRCRLCGKRFCDGCVDVAQCDGTDDSSTTLFDVQCPRCLRCRTFNGLSCSGDNGFHSQHWNVCRCLLDKAPCAVNLLG